MIGGGRGLFHGWLRGAEKWLSPSGTTCLWCGGSRLRKSGVGAGGTFAEVERLLCHSCCAVIPWIQEIHCKVCGRYEHCYDCRLRKDGVVNRSAVRYDPLMKEWLARYKYRGAETLEPLFAGMIEYAFKLLSDVLPWTGDDTQLTVVSYVPLSERRLAERGFNQAEKMAAGISRSKRLPLVPLLERTRHTEKQSYKSRRERLESLDQAFAVNPGRRRDLELKASGRKVNVILIDDVYTTGSTINTCANEMKAATGGAVKVYGLTWAR